MQVHRLAALLLPLLLMACQQPPPRSGLDFKVTPPDSLMEWRLFRRQSHLLSLNDEVMPYDLNSALFSDYAHKLRTVYVPPGTAITYGAERFEFPIGTVISKTFYYPRATAAADSAAIAVRKSSDESMDDSLDLRQVVLLETRLLVNTADGWIALPYVWNAAQTDATLEVAGESFALLLTGSGKPESFTYLVPDANQCTACHAVDHRQQLLEPLGVKPRHLNRDYAYSQGPANQLSHWHDSGLLTPSIDPEQAPRNAYWYGDDDLNSRARAYLDVNCGHCHNATAAANTSGLRLDAAETEPIALGLCKMPVAAGRGSGAALFDIVPGAPDDSIMLIRMQSTQPDIAMPELGRSLVHREGVALIRNWIASLAGSCDSA